MLTLAYYVTPPPEAYWEIDYEEGAVGFVGPGATGVLFSVSLEAKPPFKPPPALSTGRRFTVAYLPQVAEVLGTLPDEHLPPFSAVVLAMALTGTMTGGVADLFEDLLAGRYNWLTRSSDDTTGIEVLRGLPDHYRRGPARVRVLHVLLNKTHQHLKQSTSRRLVREMADWRQHLSPKDPSKGANFYTGLTALSYALARYPTTDALLLAADFLMEPDWIDEDSLRVDVAPIGGLADDLVSQLLARPDTARFAQYVPLVSAGLRVPASFRQTQAPRLGGVADISNRGPLDGLLLSEHAYDPEAFAARVANGEALYLQREPPALPQTESAVVAVDCTLPMWGTPRLLAFATALALQQNHYRKRGIDAYLLAEEPHVMASATKEAWITGLNVQSAGLSCAASLSALLAAESKAAKSGAGGPTSITLISHASILADLGFNAVLRERPGLRVHLIAVAREGRVESFLVEGTRRRSLGYFQVDKPTRKPISR